MDELLAMLYRHPEWEFRVQRKPLSSPHTTIRVELPCVRWVVTITAPECEAHEQFAIDDDVVRRARLNATSDIRRAERSLMYAVADAKEAGRHFGEAVIDRKFAEGVLP